jgi:hypothetical protein
MERSNQENSSYIMTPEILEEVKKLEERLNVIEMTLKDDPDKMQISEEAKKRLEEERIHVRQKLVGLRTLYSL